MRNLLADVWEREIAGMRESAQRDLWVHGLMLDENDRIVEMPPALDGIIGMAYAIRQRVSPTGSKER